MTSTKDKLTEILEMGFLAGARFTRLRIAETLGKGSPLVGIAVIAVPLPTFAEYTELTEPPK